MSKLQRRLGFWAIGVGVSLAAGSCAVPAFDTSLGVRQGGSGGGGNASGSGGGATGPVAGEAGAPTQSGGSVGETGGTAGDQGGSVSDQGGTAGDTGGTTGGGGSETGGGGSDTGGTSSGGSGGSPMGGAAGSVGGPTGGTTGGTTSGGGSGGGATGGRATGGGGTSGGTGGGGTGGNATGGATGGNATGGSSWTEQKFVPSDGAADDYFGRSVSISSDTAIVGAHYDDDNGTDSGSAYVLARSGSDWALQRKLVASDGAANDMFGVSVSASGDTVVVGAPDTDEHGSNSGSAYVFVRSGAAWTEQQKLIASDAAGIDSFGTSVSVSDDTAIVGAIGDDDNGSSSGSAYVFVRSGSNWTEQQKLVPSDGAQNDLFGGTVSLNGDTAIFGVENDQDNGAHSGSAYVFVGSGSNWTQQQKLVPSDGAEDDNFGGSVSVSGDTAIVGARSDDDNGSYSGSAYAFVRSGTVWTEQQKLVPTDAVQSQTFGTSVSVTGDIAVVGAAGDADNGINSGAAYVFVRSGTTWTQRQKLVASDGTADNHLGSSVSVSGDTALVGAYVDDDNGSNSGSVYFFTDLGFN